MSENFSFKIEKNLGIIAESKSGWNMELNLVSWGGRPAKYDLRSWSPDHQKMGKGCTLSSNEMESLKALLNSIEIN